MRIAQGGVSWILTGFIGAIAFFFPALFTRGFLQIALLLIFLFFLLVSVLLVVFFRDPERKIGEGVVAVADGKIREISKVSDETVGASIMISTFMNIHNVHVNRMPLTGMITHLEYHPGGHLPAYTKESEKNERVVLVLKTDFGVVKIVQIAGTIARRVVPYVKPGDRIMRGERIGIIRLGSRLDIYLPEDMLNSLTIRVGDKVQAGVDTIAKLHD